MKYRLLITLLVALILQAFSALALAQPDRAQTIRPTAPVAQLPAKNKRFAVVIGIDKYSDAQISALKGAERDAKTMADALVQYAGFPADQVTLLATSEPDARQPRRSTILRRLSNLRGLVPKDGLLLIAFAGHGMERGGKVFLLPTDAISSNDVSLLEDTAISVDRMRELIRATGVKQVMFILDSCRNDPAAGRSDTPNLMTDAYRKAFDFSARNSEVEAFVTLYAATVGQRAYEYDEMRQGYFTWALVEGLKGKAANERGEITLGGLKRYLEDTVPRLVHRDLGADRVQRPFATIEGYKAEDLVLAVTAKPAATVALPPNFSIYKPPAKPPETKPGNSTAIYDSLQLDPKKPTPNAGNSPSQSLSLKPLPIVLAQRDLSTAMEGKIIEYLSGTATLNQNGKDALKTAARFIKDHPNIVIEVAVHTDNKGNLLANWELSRKRAEACVAYLLEYGIRPERLIAKGYGDSRPIASNDTEVGRAKNRRTELTVVKVNE